MDIVDADFHAGEVPEVAEERFSFKSDSEDIMKFISTDDWENVLFALTKDMDPWDVDLLRLSERFTSFIQTLQKRDLRAPSRIILAAAIIYRLKSETLREPEEEPVSLEDVDTEVGEEIESGEPLSLPAIEVPLKREPRRRVTIKELVNALGKAMKVQNRRAARRIFNIELRGEDITKKIEEVYESIVTFIEKAKDGVVTFSSLFTAPKEKSPEEKIRNFSSLLHLSNQERITCSQPTLFGEIYISKAVRGCG
ncbi:Segregation and condensation protein A [uncultured archaeon]|nr:Segregation and condensation protein A [uncultured archaeon]